jgi:antitoxin (DNA-binding transcriptional repressor) of toxin-antitoxin stability system
MTQVTLEQAQANLADLIEGLAPGEELLLTREQQPVAKLSRVSSATQPCRAGSAKDKITWIAPDFDAPLEPWESR